MKFDFSMNIDIKFLINHIEFCFSSNFSKFWILISEDIKKHISIT